MYINDVAASISPNSDVNIFEDDIAFILYRFIKTPAGYVHLQQDIDSTSVCIQQEVYVW